MKVLIAAGGTGGHIYPAVAMAQALINENPNIEVEFVGTPDGLENQIVPREGFKLHHVSVGRLNSNVRAGERLMTLIRLPWSLLRALWIVWKTQPRFILGVGGFVTGPVLLAGALLRRKTFLWEPNAVPGMANRWLAPFVTECMVVFKEAQARLKSTNVIQVGMPVRKKIVQLENLMASRRERATDSSHPLRVLIFGGSQGAKSLNEVVSKAIHEGGDWLENVEIIHQTGPSDFDRVQHIYSSVTRPVEVLPYIHDMEKKYQWANLIISRSGASTVSELAASGKAAVLIPLASAADNHQQKNAEVLVEKSAAIMILQRDFTAGRLKQVVMDFKTNPELLDRFAKNIRQFHRPDADIEIAQHLLEATQ